MPAYRRERGDDFIREQFTLLLRDQIHDPRVRDIIITEVDLTQDRRIARVYVACYEGEETLQKGLEGLESAKGFFRRTLSHLLTWRFVPEIEFRVDRSWQYGTRIDELLRQVQERDEQRQDTDIESDIVQKDASRDGEDSEEWQEDQVEEPDENQDA